MLLAETKDLGMGGLVLLVAVPFFYFLPSLVGMKKRNSGAIFVLNLFLGWTLLGWVGAMIWACLAETPASSAPTTPEPVPAAPPASKLADDEVARLRARIEELERKSAE